MMTRTIIFCAQLLLLALVTHYEEMSTPDFSFPLDQNTGWKNSLEWHWILREKDITKDDCVLIYDSTPSPIVYSIWNTRYHRVEYLYAEICKRQSGEKTCVNQKLAAAVRARGNTGDDCGHLVGAQHGGRMVFYNLIPQDGYINRGFATDSRLFWSIIDQYMAEALQKGKNAFFETQYSLVYDNSISTTRPIQINALGRETLESRVRLFENIIPNSKDSLKIQMRAITVKKSAEKVVYEWQANQCKNDYLKGFKRYDKSDKLSEDFDVNGEKR